MVIKRGQYESAASILNTSIAQLPADEQARLFELSILPEDMETRLVFVEILWSVSSVTMESLLILFDDLSFIRLDLAQEFIRMHDVIRKVLMGRLDEPSTVHLKFAD